MLGFNVFVLVLLVLFITVLAAEGANALWPGVRYRRS